MNKKIWTIVAIVMSVILLLGGGFTLGFLFGHNPMAAGSIYGLAGYPAAGANRWNSAVYQHGYPSNRHPSTSSGCSSGMAGVFYSQFLQGEALDTAAKELGLSSDEIEKRLRQGERFWDIAGEQGLSESETADLAHKLMQQQINQAVESGLLSQETVDIIESRADWMLENGFPGMTGCLNVRGGMRSRLQ